jgi:hypothetical protein
MNPEGREQLNHLFDQKKFGKVYNFVADLGYKPETTIPGKNNKIY